MSWWLWTIVGYLGIGVIIWIGLTAIFGWFFLRTPIPVPPEERVATPKAPMAETLKGAVLFGGIWILIAMAIAIFWGVVVVWWLLDETLWKEKLNEAMGY